jgi:hypothetical protein
LIEEHYFGFNARASRSTMTMLRRWVPAGLLVASVVGTSPTILAQTAPTKTAAPTAAKPATSATTAAKPATPTAKPADPKAAKPTDPKAAATTAATATPPADAKASDPKAAGSPLTDAEKELVRLLDDAKKSFKAGQFEKARELYSAAYKQKSDHATLLLLAQAESKSNRSRDAAEHLELYLREAKTASADDRQAAQKLFEEVTAKLATWHVKVTIDGADVYLDGKVVGKSPLAAPLFVEPNTHEVEAKKEGFFAEKDMLVAAPNTESETTLVMRPAPATIEPKKIVPEEKPITPPPPPSPAWRTYGIIGGGALTALGLGLGIGLSVSSSSKGEEADAQLAELRRTTPNTYSVCGPNQFSPNQTGCAKLTDTLSSQDARANGAVFGFVLAGVGAVGTVGLILLPKLPIGRKLMGMKFTPVIGFDRLGGTVTGSF